MCNSRWAFRSLAAVLVCVLVSAAPRRVDAAEADFETPPVLKASKILSPELRQGPHFRVEENVTNDGFLSSYRIVSDYGTFEAEGEILLAIRVREVGALAQLQEVNEAAVAAGAIADSAVQMGKGVANAATHPVETVQGVPGGVKRLIGRLGRTAKRTGEKIGKEVSEATKDDPNDANAATPGPSTTDMAAKTAESAGKSVLGVNDAVRRWAQKVGVDPYTTNQVLRAELEHVASYDAGGRFATKLVPLPAALKVASSVADVSELVYSKDADELQTLNEKRLKEMGVSGDVSQRFRLNKFLSPSWQTYIVSALAELEGVKGRPDFISRVTATDTEAQAVFYASSALMLGVFHRTEAPLQEILPATRAATAMARGNRLVVLLPLDYVFWTEEFAEAVDEFAEQARKDHAAAKVEVWLTGSVSKRAKAELEKRSWTVFPDKLQTATAAAKGAQAKPAP